MDLPLEISVRDVTLNDRQEAIIREKVAGLEKFWSRINGCRVAIEGPGAHKRTGGPYKVKIDISVPGTELVVDRQEAEELEAAIHAAFVTARRRLQSYAQQRRGE